LWSYDTHDTVIVAISTIYNVYGNHDEILLCVRVQPKLFPLLEAMCLLDQFLCGNGSLYFKTHRQRYYDLLQRVRTEGV
jgi:hypothetical protein